MDASPSPASPTTHGGGGGRVGESGRAARKSSREKSSSPWGAQTSVSPPTQQTALQRSRGKQGGGVQTRGVKGTPSLDTTANTRGGVEVPAVEGVYVKIRRHAAARLKGGGAGGRDLAKYQLSAR